MDVTKTYEFIWFGDIHGPKPYKFIGLRWAFVSQTPVAQPRPGMPTSLAFILVGRSGLGPRTSGTASMYTKPYEFIGFGAMAGTKPYEFIGISPP
jgi:hypothetical protein